MRFYPLMRWLYLLNFFLFTLLTLVHFSHIHNAFDPLRITAEIFFALFFLCGYFTIYWELSPSSLESHYLWMRKSIAYERIATIKPARPKWYNLGQDAVQVLTRFNDGIVIRTEAQARFP